MFDGKKVVFKETCGGCPEAYDAYIDGRPVGYLRLRHGYFSVEYMGEEVYSDRPQGDGLFEWDERHGYLNRAAFALLQEHARRQTPGDDAVEEVTLYEVVHRNYDAEIREALGLDNPKGD